MRPAATLPPPQPVRHRDSLWWWFGLLLLAVATQLPALMRPALAPPTASLGPGANEGHAFHAFAFGDVGRQPGALDPRLLRAQLERLVDSGAAVVGLHDAGAFLREGRALAAHPVVLAFEHVGRDTIEAVDPILDDLGLRAVAFVAVDAVADGNISLVSRRRLAEMAQGGRWELAVRACNGRADDTGELARQAALLRDWTGAAPLAASCLREWRRDAQGIARWDAALARAALPLGFVAHAPGANLRGDPSPRLRVIRIGAAERDADALVRRAAAHSVRPGRYADDFAGGALAADWLADAAQARVEDGALHVRAARGEPATLLLGGTERWRDVRIDARVQAPAHGQLWLHARHRSARSFVRLGVVDGRIVLQTADGAGTTRQLASVPLPAGPVELSLRVLGGRALAYADGRALVERPVALPAGLGEGPVTLVAWDAERAIAAALERIEVAPLAREVALLPADARDDEFSRLRARADTLWAVSPRLYRWRDGAGSANALRPAALAMFARHHRFELLPAVTLDALPGDDWPRFREQALQWAARPGHAGLNLVVDVADADTPRVEDLRRALAAQGKELVVTPRTAPR